MNHTYPKPYKYFQIFSRIYLFQLLVIALSDLMSVNFCIQKLRKQYSLAFQFKMKNNDSRPESSPL